MGVVSWVHGILEGSTDYTSQSSRLEEQNESVAEETRGSMFQCPSCETVYIANDMTRCSRCDVAVDDVQPVRSLLAGSD
jgi:predicted RNA-binding Zn-ribbon protein involved in translation (DUF1610 family)